MSSTLAAQDSDVEMMEPDSDDGPEWNPDQSIEERRNIRKEYRELIEKAEARRANVTTSLPDDLSLDIVNADKKFGRVKQTHEATLDSRFLIISAETATVMAKNMRIDKNAFDTDDFLARVKRFMGTNRHGVADDANDVSSDEEETTKNEKLKARADALTRVARLALKYSHRAPTCDFMLGPLAFEPKKKEPKKKADKAQTNAPVAEKEVTQLEEGDIQKDDQETTRMVIKINQLLIQVLQEREADYIDLFEFIINPDSFSQTVENLFYLSFLIKEGRAGIDTKVAGALGQPMLSSTDPPTEEAHAEAQRLNRPIRKKQIFIDLDMQAWEDAIDLYDITESIIPNRAPPPSRKNGKWMG